MRWSWIVFALLALAPIAQAVPPHYRLKDLGPGEVYYFNNRGDVAAIRYSDGHAVLIQSEGAVIDFSAMPELVSLCGLGSPIDITFGGLNDEREVVLDVFFAYSDVANCEFTYSNGVLTYIATLGKGDFATAVNYLGQIVGRGYYGGFGPGCEFVNPSNPYQPIAINNHGQVLANGEVSEAYLCTSGQLEQIPPIGADTSVTGAALNKHGDVVGVSGVSSNTNEHGLLYRRGRSYPLGTYDPADINDRGQIVAFAGPTHTGAAGKYGFLRDEEGIWHAIEDLLPEHSALRAADNTADFLRINNRGEIAFYVEKYTSQIPEIYVLTPTPERSSE